MDAGDAGSDAGAGGFFFQARTLNIAHRGGMALAPEATLVAFDNALRVGADALELDLHATEDGVLVVLHDDTVDRTTDGTGAVKEMSLAALKALDAGHDFTLDGGQTFPHRGKGLRVPTLDEVLRAFPDEHFVMEIKQAEPPIVGDLLSLLDEHGLGPERVVVGSFDLGTVQELRRVGPERLTSFALSEVVEFVFLTPETEGAYVPPAEFLQVPIEQLGVRVLTDEFLARAERFDLGTHWWTINDPAVMQDLVGRSVSGIITDDPETLSGILGRSGE